MDFISAKFVSAPVAAPAVDLMELGVSGDMLHLGGVAIALAAIKIIF